MGCDRAKAKAVGLDCSAKARSEDTLDISFEPEPGEKHHDRSCEEMTIRVQKYAP